MQNSLLEGISVVVVVKDEEKDILDCLLALVSQKFSKPFEILVIDNCSKDNTPELVRTYAQTHPQIHFLTNKKIGIVFSRNMGVRTAKFEYIAFTDADCIPPNNWLENLYEGFKKFEHLYPTLCAVGGGNQVLLPSSLYSRALHVFLQSYLGSHNSTNGKIFYHTFLVDHLPTTNVLYKRELLLTHPFDESLTFGGSDLEISARLHSLGYLSLYIPETIVLHKREPTLYLWCKSMWKYGRSRVAAAKINRTLRTPLLFAPLCCTLAFLIFPFGIVHPVFFLPFLLYFFILTFYSFFVSPFQPALIPMLLLLYSTTHISYGMGELQQLFYFLRHKTARHVTKFITK